MACELPTRIAAIAVVAANMADERGNAHATGCHPARPVSVPAIHSIADTAVPLSSDGRFAPFDAVLTQWRELDGCTGPGTVGTAGPASRTDWSCQAGSTVRAILLTGVGHTWPDTLAGLAWGPAEALDASSAVTHFFAGHGRGSR